ncbi:MAG: PorT family protein [Cytophagaceae bacterium]|jgi:hypothetical protein|nr:PorT family protein [Cytophagaceae bacterium]
MKQIIIFAVCFLLSIAAVFSQHLATSVEHEVIADSDKGYYIANSVVYGGIYILKENRMERTKRIIIPEQKGHEAKTLYPKDIDEFGFANGVKYVSAQINIYGNKKNVFLEEIINIKNSVFLYVYCNENSEDIFFILEENENRLKQIDSNSPEEVWSIFKKLNDCEDIQGLESFPQKLTRKQINVFYSAYKDCNSNLFPQFQFGPVINLGMGKPVLREVPSYSYGFNLAVSVGGYAQLPLDECIALRTEILYSYLNNNRGVIDMMQKASSGNSKYMRHSIQIPLLVKYTFNYKAWKNIPYIEMGPCFDYCFYGGKFKNGKLQKPEKNTVLDDFTIINFQYGISLGAGVEHKIAYNKSIYLGFRYNWVTGVRQEYVEKLKFLGLNVAINM